MVDISSGDKKINITVSTSGNKASVNATPDTAMYYSNKSREWAISDKIVDNKDYSSKYYANVSKQNADKSTVNLENLTTNYNQYKNELENTKNISVEEIETAKTNAISDITNQETLSVDNVNTAGATQVNLAKEQATIATAQAGIATAKTSEVVESGNTALTAITEQETTSKNNIETKGAEQIALIQNEGATQVANVQSTGFYMRDDKLYYINSQGEEAEFKSGGSGLELCDIGMALYIDETKGLRRYLNGQIVDINTNTQAFLNRLKEITTLHPSLLCTEEEWQTAKTMSAFGQVGKFVFNYSGNTVVSVRIPAIVNVQGLFDLQNLGLTIEAGLPNITGSFTGGQGGNATGAFKNTGANGTVSGTNANMYTYNFDASRSNSIYGNSDTVQPEAIQYPYFIQIATGSETENNIINEIELNNPYSLFDSKYSDHELNNLSWLKSSGQWNAKAVYPTAYDKLLKVYNGTETVEGLSVKLSTEEYTDYDFVLNTSDETFRLPLLDGSEDLMSDRSDDLELLASGTTYTAPANGWFRLSFYSSSVTDKNQLVTLVLRDNNNTITLLSVTNHSSAAGQALSVFVPARKGQIVKADYNIGNITPSTHKFNFAYAKGNGSLYFYVGETAQNANLIDAGRIGEQLANKQDKLSRYPIEISDKSLMPSWYVVYSDGWCEQGGYNSNALATINLLKQYTDTNYIVITTILSKSSSGSYYATKVSNKTTSDFIMTGNEIGSMWQTSGYVR